jgi:hypothetical protein
MVYRMENQNQQQTTQEQQQDSTESAQKEQQNTEQAQTTQFAKRTYKKKELMLQALIKLKGANVSQAAQLAGISRRTHYDWLKNDLVYRQKAENAFQELGDTLESVAYSMAIEKHPQVLLATLKAKFKDRGWGEDNKPLVQLNQGFQLNIVKPEEAKPSKKEEAKE